MTFFSVVSRGLMRRPVRTGLTVAGIAVSIAAVVALVGIARGFDRSWDKGMKARGTDIVVSNMGSSLTPKPFPAEVKDRIANLPGVDATCGILVELMSVETSDMMMVSAREWGGFSWGNVKVVEGRLPNGPDEPAVVLGKTAADLLKKKVGDTLQLEIQELTVVGIVDGGAWVENGSAILSLTQFQEIMGVQGKINIIDVRATPGSTQEELEELCRQIDARVPEGRAMIANEHIANSQSFKMARGMSWGTSLLAVMVGVLGVMNTMLMTVFERTKELCILLALGWKRGRVMGMILLESALLGFIGGIVGTALGVVVARLMQNSPAIRGLLEPDLGPDLLATSLGIAVAVGLVSGLYPAWRSSRLKPALALQG